MIKVIIIEKSKIFDSKELEKIVNNLIKLNSNLLVFGLPYSGKSTLIKAICKKSKQFLTLKEEEVTEEKNGHALKKTLRGKKWVVGHQFPSMNENISSDSLRVFLAKQMGLKPENWEIIRIKANN